MKNQSNYLWVLIGLFWTVVIAAFAWQETAESKRDITSLARIEARSSYNKDLVFRRWGAKHGGVYAPVTKETPPNPYLKDVFERDIETPSGRKLTLINPAYMTRQTYELSEDQYGVKGHITSLNPLRPENKADTWETEVLHSFEDGNTFAETVVTLDGESYQRAMYPMVVEKTCLKCHETQGYKLGDIRGGISVSVPLKHYLNLYQKTLPKQMAYHLGLWFVGVLGLLAFRKKTNEHLLFIESSKERYRSLVENTDDLITRVDSEGRLLYVNQSSMKYWGVSPDKCLGQPAFDFISPKDKERTVQHFQSWLETGNPFVTFENRQLHVSGQATEMLWTISPIRDSKGEITEFSGIARDITERIRAEQALKSEIKQHEKSQRLLRQSEERYKALSDASFGGIIIHDKGLILECNQGLAVMTGFTCEELVGMDGLKLIAPGSLDLVLHNIKIGYEKRYEVEGIRKNGSTYPLSIRGKNVVYKGRDVRVIEFKDVTELKRHEILQRAQLRLIDYSSQHSIQELLQKFLEESESLTQSRIGFYHFVDEDKGTLTLQAWSRNTLENFCTAKGVGHHYPISEAGVWTESIKRRKPVIHNDFASLPNKKGMPEGHASVVREMVVPVFREDRIVAILGVGNKASDYSENDIKDVQELADMAWEIVVRKQSEQALSESEERFHKMFRSHDAVMLLIEPETGKIVEANDAASAFYGYSKEEFQLLSIHDINPLPKEDVDAARDKALSGKQNNFEFKHRLSTGETRDVEVHVSSIPMDKKMLLFSIIHDISQRKKLMEEQSRSAQLAALGTVAAGVAHEINNPIQGIMNYASLIKMSPDRKERNLDISQRIIDESERIAKITRDLLHYSKDSRIEKALVNIQETIESALSLIAPKMHHGDFSLESSYQEGLPHLVVQPQSIQQVIINLVDNAYDALRYKENTTEMKVIHVCANVFEEQEGLRLVIEVSDNGVGMSDDTLKKALEAFFTTKPSTEGTGLGLSIVNDIVKKHNGLIDIESKEGEYTRIKVIIPAVLEL